MVNNNTDAKENIWVDKDKINQKLQIHRAMVDQKGRGIDNLRSYKI